MATIVKCETTGCSHLTKEGLCGANEIEVDDFAVCITCDEEY
jgi:hypothetical protein